MNSEEQFDKIEAYLKGQLSEQEQAAFEAKLADDSKLQEEVALHKLEHQSLELLMENDLREKMGGWKKKRIASKTQEKPAKRSFLTTYRPWLAAASIALLILTYFLWPKPTTLTGSQIADLYYEVPNTSTERTTTNPEEKNPLEEGLTLFENGEYSNAAAKFGVISSESPYYWQAQEWLGHSQFLAGQWDEAAVTFQNISQQANPPLPERNEWNALLTFLKNEQMDDARKILNKLIKNEAHAYHNKALLLDQQISR